MDLYERNHHPRYAFLEPIQTFKERTAFPDALYNLDILDGSPPCSTFTIAMARTRQETWGKEKRFREGQAEQVLDTLFFDFIDVVRKLRPKVVIAENVKGLLQGAAKKYVQRIHMEFEDAGYTCQHFLLDAQYMGVPQHRERVFFVCLRKDLVGFVPCEQTLFETLPRLNMNFNEAVIPFKDVADGMGDGVDSPKMRKCWELRMDGDSDLSNANYREFGKSGMFNNKYVYPDKVCPTLAAQKNCLIRFDIPKYLSATEVCCVSSFPQDYNFGGQIPHYVCGMSVPPIMMAQIASRVYEQWLSKIKTA